MSIRWCASIESDCAMKREEAIAIYRAGEEPVVEKLCELSAKVDEQAKKIAVLQKNSSNSSKPPSSDITKPPKKKKGNGKKKNKRGANPVILNMSVIPLAEMRSMRAGNIIAQRALTATTPISPCWMNHRELFNRSS